MRSRNPQAVAGLVVAVLAALLVPMVGPAPEAGALPTQFPDDFRLDLVHDGLEQPTSMTFLPDGRILTTSKTGSLEILAAPTGSIPVAGERYITLSGVQKAGERGVMNVVVDPDFANNGYVYVFYTASTARNRIVRYTHQENAGGTTSRADANSAFLVWESPVTLTSCCHVGGGMTFGSDGLLYFTVGDDFDAANSQPLSHPGGKIHRINSDGTIPATNPYNDGPGPNVDTIIANGLRNPFRMSWDTIDDRPLLGVVGGNVHSIAYEDIVEGRVGANYGWPDCEGSGRYPDASCVDPAFDDPLFSYPHDGEQASVTGGVRYTGTEFPAELQGAYFYGDFANGWIRYLTFDGDGDVVSDNEFMSLPDDDSGNVVDFKEGPDGALYYVQIAGSFPFGTVANSCEAGCIRRVVYERGNSAPVVVNATATPNEGPAPLAVQFNAAATDSEGEPLTYSWDFGDGATGTGTDPTHTYTTDGPKSAVVSVSDGTNTSTAVVPVSVGTPPTVTIDSPVAESSFRAGDLIDFDVTAADSTGAPIPEADIEWVVRFHHNEHFHPAAGPDNGSTLTYEIPSSGHDYYDNTRYQAEVTATDANGLRTTKTVVVYPDKVDLNLTTVPAGLDVRLDGVAIPAGEPYDTLIGFNHTASVQSQCFEGRQYDFASWSDGVTTASHPIVVPDTDLTLTAVFEDVGSCAVPTEGMVLRLVGDDAVADTAGVTQWGDGSGTGNDLTVVGGAPQVAEASLGGHDVVTFDGVDDALGRDGFAGAPVDDDDRTVVMVASYDTAGWGGLSWGRRQTNRVFGVGVGASDVGTAPMAVQGWGTTNDFPSTTDVKGQGFFVQSVKLEGNTLEQYKDGTLVDSDTHAFATNDDLIRLGVEIDGSPAVGMGLAEAIVYDRALSPTELTNVESYLQDRYLDGGSSGPDTTPPEVGVDQSFSVPTPATVGQAVGTVSATDASGIAGFAITGGNTGGAFAIDSGGNLTVASAAAVDPAVNPTFTLDIEAVDGAGNPGAGSVSITVLAPSDLPAGLVLRLEGDDVTSSGGTVTGWSDLSGSGNNLAPTGDPSVVQTPSGENAIRFDGAGDALRRIGGVNDLPAGAADRSVFVVADYRSSGYGGFAWGKASSNKVFGLGVAPPSGNLMVQAWGGNHDKISAYPGNGQGWLVQSAVVGSRRASCSRSA